MITEKDLQEAIAECEGARNPNANTCIKLAAFYTIKRELFGGKSQPTEEDYSFSGADDAQTIISYDGISEFAQSVNGADQKSVMSIMDELMEALYVMQPKLYRSVISKLTGL